jgi:DNA-binding CsgD family transcriptional regulator
MERAGIVPETVETLLRDAKQRLQVRRNEHLLVRRPQRES